MNNYDTVRRVTLSKKESKLHHQLQPYFAEMMQFPTYQEFKQSALYSRIAPELERILNGVEWANYFSRSENLGSIKAASWNIERGIHLEGIRHNLLTHPDLCNADIVLLVEVDIGMGRSGNRNTVRELAAALEMNYCYANSFLVLGKGDEGEQDHDLPNRAGLHGAAILSKYPIKQIYSVSLPAAEDGFCSLEKRLGSRKALIADIEINRQVYTFAAVHLDLKCSPAHRAAQLAVILQAMDGIPTAHQLLGGDLNTHTYNLSSSRGLLAGLLYRMLFLGFDEAIAHYMKPDQFFEREVFRVFREFGFDYGCHQHLNSGTLYFQWTEPATFEKSSRYLPNWLIRKITGKLAKWREGVPMKLDWMATRNWNPVVDPRNQRAAAKIIAIPPYQGRRVSDHRPLTLELPLHQQGHIGTVQSLEGAEHLG